MPTMPSPQTGRHSLGAALNPLSVSLYVELVGLALGLEHGDLVDRAVRSPNVFAVVGVDA